MLNKVILIDLYINKKLSITDIGRLLKVPFSRVRTALIKNEIPVRTRADGVRNASHKLGVHAIGKERSFSDEWKNNISKSRLAHGEKFSKGISLKPNGYLEHTRGEHKGRLVHVVIMEQSIGRRIKKDECVHHVDENKTNNKIENLMLMTRASHQAHHARSKAEKTKGASLC